MHVKMENIYALAKKFIFISISINTTATVATGANP